MVYSLVLKTYSYCSQINVYFVNKLFFLWEYGQCQIAWFYWKDSSLQMLFLNIDMGLICFTKHEPVGVVGQIIPVSYMWCFARFGTICTM